MLNRFRDVFRCFQKHEVRYLVIGGVASILYGVPRATFDLDILIEATPENVKRLLDALSEAKLRTASLTTVDDVLTNEISIFNDRIRIDVQTSTPGILFRNAWKQKVTMDYHGQEFHVVCKHDLISCKRAAGRDADLEDARLLELPESDVEERGHLGNG